MREKKNNNRRGVVNVILQLYCHCFEVEMDKKSCWKFNLIDLVGRVTWTSAASEKVYGTQVKQEGTWSGLIVFLSTSF